MEALERRCLNYFYEKNEEAYRECAKITKYVPVTSGGIEILDLRYFASNLT